MCLPYVADCPTYFENDLITLVHHKHVVLPTCHRLKLYMQSPIMGINRCYIKYLPKGLSYSVYMLENGGKYLEYTLSTENMIYTRHIAIRK
jgi:hypothetical protein